jgi:phosphohistidine swiveling domain-containing protein
MLRKASFEQVNWKLINFRTVSNFITAEFLHDLYNRHSYEVNSIRFRNTLCLLNRSDFRSFAPQAEWDMLERELGERFFERDPILLEELELYIKKDKQRLKNFLNKIKPKINSFSAKECYQALSHLHFLALGEIYGINLVQIEHALSWAISRHFMGNATDFSVYPTFKWESQKKKMKKSIIEYSLKLAKDKGNLDYLVDEITEIYGHFKNAYGTDVNSQNEIRSQLIELSRLSLEERKIKYALLNSESSAKVDESYADLYQLASQVGELRDCNKLLMGKVAAVRKQLLNHIAVSMQLSCDVIRWYSLSELGSLVRYGNRLSLKEIAQRNELVIFKREEGFHVGCSTEELHRVFLRDIKKAAIKHASLPGIIASKGKVIGRAHLVYTASDCDTMQENAIMIAYGTDFDLLLGISKCVGIVTEEGGILSHASIVSRELNKPCLINVCGAMSAINNQDLIELDCEAGILKILQVATDQQTSLIQKLTEINPENFTSKIANLHRLKKLGHQVLPGLCISIEEKHTFDAAFFEQLKNKIRDYLKTDNVIIRQSTALEDQADKSFAGVSCSRVCITDLRSLSKTFLETAHVKRGENVYGKECKNRKLDLLIQPYRAFDYGGVTFIQTDSLLNRYALVEASDKGPYHCVKGKATQRLLISIYELNNIEAPQYMIDSIQVAQHLTEQLGYDVDMEWGVANDTLWILQARPVTVSCAV